MTTVLPAGTQHEDGQLELEAFRTELRAFLASNPPPVRNHGHAFAEELSAADIDELRSWRRRMHAGRWGAVAWPVAYGGRGATASQQLAYHEEILRAGGEVLNDLFLVGIAHAGPTIIAEGTPSQKERWLEPILSGDTVVAQCFSEPGAGSDLAAIATRGVVEDGHLVVTGEKRWSTFAQHADIAELLVRTDPTSRHGGLTYLMVDLHSEGISINPLRTIGGDSHFCEVRFDNVRIPLDNVIGALGQGWQVATTTLLHERSTVSAPLVLDTLHTLKALTRAVHGDPVAENEVGSLAAQALALKALLHQSVAEQEAGAMGPGSSALKLLATELNYEAKAYQARRDPDALLPWLTAFGLRIGGGTSEIQKTIIAERILGLPRHR